MKFSIRLAPALLLLAAACGGDDTDDNTGSDTRTLTVSFTDLPALGAAYVYEGWFIVTGETDPVTTGRFTVDANGAPSQASWQIPAATADGATKFVLTIEPAENDPPGPAATKILAGDVANGAANLTISDAAIFGTDFSSAAGTFVLATPTSMDMTDDNQGIWFLDDSTGMPAASLTLPDAPDGWAYEGWVVDLSGTEHMPISTGTFTSVGGADSDAGGPTAGTDGFSPPFPGQDFINPARDLTSQHMAVISIEPVPDDSPAPFRLKPLAAMVGTSTGVDNPHTLNNVIGNNGISGSITIQ